MRSPTFGVQDMLLYVVVAIQLFFFGTFGQGVHPGSDLEPPLGCRPVVVSCPHRDSGQGTAVIGNDVQHEGIYLRFL